MPQPHATTTIAAANHHHSHSLAHAHAHAQTPSAGNHPRPSPNYPPSFPPRSSSSVARYPPVGQAPARSESVPSVPYIRSNTPGNSAHNKFHYNRARSGTVDNSSSSASAYYNGGNLDDSAIKAQVASDLRYFSSASRTRNPSIDGFPPRPPAATPPSFFAASLPRTSSLLPPPRGFESADSPNSASVGPSADVTPIAENAPSLPPDSLTNSRRRSRASSLGAASDGFRNLNRWSASTTSSLASPTFERDQSKQQALFLSQQQQQPPPPASPARPTNFSRRMSVDSIAFVNQVAESPQNAYQSPRKLTKRRPSVANAVPISPRTTSAAATRAHQHSPHQPAPPPNLPPIVSLPSLELSTPTLTSSFNRTSPSTATSSDEPKDRFWDEQTDPDSTSPTATRANPPALLPAATVMRDTTMAEANGHTRSRSSAKGSIDSGRGRKQPSQKAMLSKALAKANTAVQLDNAHNYVGARTSYLEACELLRQVLARTTGEDDQRKLEAIRRTYASRIDELDGMLPVQTQTADKALPARPESLAYNEEENYPDSEDDGVSPTTSRKPDPTVLALTSSFSSRPANANRRNFEGTLSVPKDSGQLMPAPLSPRRPLSPAKPASPEPAPYQENRLAAHGHSRGISHESLSWLDPIDESEASELESVHSRNSSFGAQRKHMRVTSGNTEAEFDAALDAAVEAAYDDGFDAADSYDGVPYEEEEDDDHVVADVMRRVEIAKARVRETEREVESEREAAIRAAHEQERQRQLSRETTDSIDFNNSGFYDGEDSDEEEERMLEDLTRDYALNSFSFSQQARKPSDAGRERESGSSGITHRTWHSSIGSSPPTANTVLSSVTELPSPMNKPPASSLPPPPQSLPQLPRPQTPNNSSVRSRRLSGQNAKQLKIETSQLPGSSGAMTSVHVKPGSYIAQQRQAMSATATKPPPFPTRSPPSPGRGGSPPEDGVPPMTSHYLPHAEDPDDFRAGSPQAPPAGPALRKNQSSSSLKSLKARQASASYGENGSELSPHTPLSQTLTNSSVSRHPMPALPTPLAASFNMKAAGGFNSMTLFDSGFHVSSPHSPSAVHAQGSDVPLPLEPCPADVMLRPFWLMRALYQTLCHPRGGYITSRLFVPRDVWKVKGVKLRALEDKASQCDLLTAALQKLARVDSNDADAVLEEMQNLENILEQVQQNLSRKLGNEVGTQSAAAYRDREEAEAMPAVPRSSSVGGKAGAFSWRRLRNKGSAVNLTNAYGSKSNSGTGERIPEREVFTGGSGTLPSLPMVAVASSRPAKRDMSSVKFDGPYGGYMQSLARLFDAAQTVDLIARQVDDPGLRHADKTQVGLELCTRHAAEFFGFYICRFVLADLGLLLDKFVKRGSEWVLN